MTVRRFTVYLLVVLACASPAGCTGTRAVPAVAAVAVVAGGSGGVNRPEHLDKPYVVLVSLDGFRADYLERQDVPNLRRVMRRGARASSLMPVFPSLTFPNHYSLVTGLYVDRHGIVANTFYDPARRQTYSLSDRGAVSDGTWYRGEPIWVTAETQGMVASCFFWPGSEAAIKGVRPSEWRTYDPAVTIDERVRTVLQWLRLSPERRPHLVTVYFSEVDSAAHGAPLDSPAVADAIRAVDGAVGALSDGLEALPIAKRVYLLITSDHGTAETTAQQSVRLDALVNMEELEEAFGGEVASLHLRDPSRAPGMRDALNGQLQHGRAYLRDEVPAHHRYRGDPRMGHIVVIMEEAWSLAVPPRMSTRKRERWGSHGWDPALPSMQAIFVAAGPGIAAGTTIPTVRNVDVYPLMTALLGLRTPAEIDGRLPGSMQTWSR